MIERAKNPGSLTMWSDKSHHRKIAGSGIIALTEQSEASENRSEFAHYCPGSPSDVLFENNGVTNWTLTSANR